MRLRTGIGGFLMTWPLAVLAALVPLKLPCWVVDDVDGGSPASFGGDLAGFALRIFISAWMVLGVGACAVVWRVSIPGVECINSWGGGLQLMSRGTPPVLIPGVEGLNSGDGGS